MYKYYTSVSTNTNKKLVFVFLCDSDVRSAETVFPCWLFHLIGYGGVNLNSINWLEKATCNSSPRFLGMTQIYFDNRIIIHHTIGLLLSKFKMRKGYLCLTDQKSIAIFMILRYGMLRQSFITSVYATYPVLFPSSRNLI